MAYRLAEISVRADAILSDGDRKEVTCLLALVAGLTAVAKMRLLELREQPSAPARHLTVKAAAAAFPVSRSFLYERGESLGLVNRTSTGRIIVIESALRAYLEGQRA